MYVADSRAQSYMNNISLLTATLIVILLFYFSVAGA